MCDNLVTQSTVAEEHNEEATYLIVSEHGSRHRDAVWEHIYVWVCLCLFERVGLCMNVSYFNPIIFNMLVYSIELCVSLCVPLRACIRVCVCVAGHLSGNNREQSEDVIRRWLFPNAVLSVRRRGGIQMTCVLLWRTRSLGGNHSRCVCVCDRGSTCVSDIPCANLQSWLCSCIKNSCQISFLQPIASAPMYSSLLHIYLYLTVRKYPFSHSSSVYGAFISYMMFVTWYFQHCTVL